MWPGSYKCCRHVVEVPTDEDARCDYNSQVSRCLSAEPGCGRGIVQNTICTNMFVHSVCCAIRRRRPITFPSNWCEPRCLPNIVWTLVQRVAYAGRIYVSLRSCIVISRTNLTEQTLAVYSMHATRVHVQHVVGYPTAALLFSHKKLCYVATLTMQSHRSALRPRGRPPDLFIGKLFNTRVHVRFSDDG